MLALLKLRKAGATDVMCYISVNIPFLVAPPNTKNKLSVTEAKPCLLLAVGADPLRFGVIFLHSIEATPKPYKVVEQRTASHTVRVEKRTAKKLTW